MSETQSAETALKFIANPGPDTALSLINSMKGLIINLATAWHLKNVSQAEKMRELMSEMLLILLEDFSPERASGAGSIVSYLKMKLKRLTHPAMRRETPFGGAFDMGELGRCNFSGLRLQLADEICAAVRRCLLGISDPATGLLEFLFIHVYPELNWASRLIAGQSNIDAITALNADKKRHSRFNNLLRAELQNLNSGELHDIGEWSGGERSHLAWRIIGISINEIEAEDQKSLAEIDHWRETIDRRQPQPVEKLAFAQKVLASMKNVIRNKQLQLIAAEEAEPYGEVEDIIVQLIGRRSETDFAKEESTQWNSETGLSETVSDKDFAATAAEVCAWLEKLTSERSSKTGKNKKTSDYSSI